MLRHPELPLHNNPAELAARRRVRKRDVSFGPRSPTGAAAWDEAVRAGTGRAWVVQERVAIPEEPFPAWVDGRLRFEDLKVNVNPFYVAGAEVGAVARASRQAVINVSAGGGSVPAFVVG